MFTKGGISISKIRKINITLPEEELRRIDDFARKDSFSRSGFIRQAARFYMEHTKQKEEERKCYQRMQQAALNIHKFREKAGNWDGVAEIRKWRETR